MVHRGNGNLRKDIRGLAASNKRHRFWIVVSVVGLTLDLGLSGIVWYLFDRVEQASSAVVVNCRGINQAVAVVTGVFDPLYDPKGRPVEPGPEQEAYDAYTKLRDGYPQDCDDPKSAKTTVTSGG